MQSEWRTRVVPRWRILSSNRDGECVSTLFLRSVLLCLYLLLYNDERISVLLSRLNAPQ